MQKRKNSPMAPFRGNSILLMVVGLAVAFSLTEPSFARQRSRTRRSQRVRMEQVQVAGPDGNVKLT
ncbi:MAG: hypothetical protein KAS19_02830, partial [Anaerolineales bacterium]|nr:hypothetical protein [Anaerolineales bacterium]